MHVIVIANKSSIATILTSLTQCVKHTISTTLITRPIEVMMEFDLYNYCYNQAYPMGS